MMKKALGGFALLLLLLAAYLALWPVASEPVAWTVQPSPGYVGPHAANQRLARLQQIDLKGERGPEHVAVGPDGRLYVAVEGGRILRMNPDGSGQAVFANTGGRVLGFAFDGERNLIAADAFRGLLAVAPDGKVSLLADQVEGGPIRFADAVAIARDGKVYFTDATTRFSARELGITEASTQDVIEQSATGRVLAYDPATKAVRVVARGLAFANGIVLSADEQTLFVCETGRYRIWKIPVDGKRPGHALFGNLPGFPDNLVRGLDGRIWAGLVKPRNPDADDLAGKPFMRKVILRLPRALWPIPKDYTHVFAFTEDGRVVADLQDPSGAYPEATGVTETQDRLYIQNLHGPTLGWLQKPVN